METILNWFRRQLANPQVIILGIVLLLVFSLIIFWGALIAPVIAALVIAYVLEGAVRNIEKLKVPRFAAVLITISMFVVLVIALVFGVLPLFSAQAVQFASQVPNWIAEGQAVLQQLPQSYPDVVSEAQVQQMIEVIAGLVTELGQNVIAWSASSVVGVITLIVYLILVPILVFFFLKDKRKLLEWSQSFIPNKDHGLTQTVWENVNRQMSNYVRGKFWEILIVGGATFVAFRIFGLQYSLLLSVIVGLSVLIPYVGAVVVTVPVVLVAFFQWGFTPDFAYLVIAYAVIQLIDGNVLVPMIFSEVVNLHPIAIIVAVLFFGGLWGVWGVFFAIPLATLVRAILISWPKAPVEEV